MNNIQENSRTNASRLTTGAKIAFGAALYTQVIAAGLEGKILIEPFRNNTQASITEVLETPIVISEKTLAALAIFNLGSIALLCLGLKMKGRDPSSLPRKPNDSNRCNLG